MPARRLRFWPVLLAPALLCALPGCGGKLAPLPDGGDAGDVIPSGDAGDDAGDDGPFVTSVAPASGPNSGGTRVVIRGRGFAPGDSAATFANFPASDVSCSSTTECTAVSPFAGYQDFDQPIHVQITAHASSDAGGQTSPTTPLDVFTYLAGPLCGFNLTCVDAAAFPRMIINCPVPVSFYRLSGHTPQQPPVVASSYTVGTEDFTVGLVACFGDPATTSCSTYLSPATHMWDCGTADFCLQCTRMHGKCYPNDEPPTCAR